MLGRVGASGVDRIEVRARFEGTDPRRFRLGACLVKCQPRQGKKQWRQKSHHRNTTPKLPGAGTGGKVPAADFRTFADVRSAATGKKPEALIASGLFRFRDMGGDTARPSLPRSGPALLVESRVPPAPRDRFTLRLSAIGKLWALVILSSCSPLLP